MVRVREKIQILKGLQNSYRLKYPGMSGMSSMSGLFSATYRHKLAETPPNTPLIPTYHILPVSPVTPLLPVIPLIPCAVPGLFPEVFPVTTPTSRHIYAAAIAMTHFPLRHTGIDTKHGG